MLTSEQPDSGQHSVLYNSVLDMLESRARVVVTSRGEVMGTGETVGKGKRLVFAKDVDHCWVRSPNSWIE